MHLKDWDRARSDLIEARDKGLDIVAEFYDGYKSIADFEEELDDRLPVDIAAMLRR